MDNPRPTEAHSTLAKLKGTWSGEDTFSPSPIFPQGAVAQTTMVCRAALGGLAVICDYEQKMDGKTIFEGHGVFRYGADKYFLHWFDSMGMPPTTYEGGFEDGVFTLDRDTPEGLFCLIYDVRKPGLMTFRMEITPSGADSRTMLDGRYRLAG